MMDTRRVHGQYWPAHRTDAGGDTPAGTDNGKVDRVDLGTLPADATASEMRTAIRNLQNAMRPLATAIAAALCGFAMAQTAAWDSLRGGVHVVTNEQDSAAIAAIATATNDIAIKMSTKQDALPYPTNAIPYSVMTNAPAETDPTVPAWAKAETPPQPDYTTSNTQLVATIEATAPAPGDYETVSNRAMNAVQTENDPTVPAWAKAETPPQTMTDNDVRSIVAKLNVATSWVFSASAETGTVEFLLSDLVVWSDGREAPPSYDFTIGGVRYTDQPGLWNGSVSDYSCYLTFNTAGRDYTQWECVISITPQLMLICDITQKEATSNALGLARLVDLPPVVTNIARGVAHATNRYLYDSEHEVCYRVQMNGFLDLIAVTNIDLTLPENWQALEKIEAEWSNR